MHPDDHRVDRALAGAHHCDPHCPACTALRDLEDEHRPGTLNGWEHFISSDQAIRFAHNEAEFGIPFPTVSSDDVIQYVVHESAVERYHEERAAELEHEERRRDAAGEAQRRLREAVGR